MLLSVSLQDKKNLDDNIHFPTSLVFTASLENLGKSLKIIEVSESV